MSRDETLVTLLLGQSLPPRWTTHTPPEQGHLACDCRREAEGMRGPSKRVDLPTEWFVLKMLGGGIEVENSLPNSPCTARRLPEVGCPWATTGSDALGFRRRHRENPASVSAEDFLGSQEDPWNLGNVWTSDSLESRVKSLLPLSDPLTWPWKIGPGKTRIALCEQGDFPSPC